MKFLHSKHSNLNYRFIYFAAPEAAEGPFSAEKHVVEEKRSDEDIKKGLAELNTKFGNQVKADDIPKYIKEIDGEGADEYIDDIKDIQALAEKLEKIFSTNGSIEELGLENLTKEEMEKVKANIGKLKGELDEHFKGKDVDPNLIESSMNEALKEKGKENLMNETFVMGVKDEVVAKIEQSALPATVKLAQQKFPNATPEQQKAIGQAIGQLDNKILDALRKNDEPIPGISSDHIDPRITKKVEEKINALVDTLKDKKPEEVLSALDSGSDAIVKAILEDPILQTIKEEREKAYTDKSLSNESLATGVVKENPEDGESPLDLREGSIYKVEDLNVGPPAQDIKFPNSEDLKTIGAGDLYPPEVRAISINGKTATREGVGGGFFYENGEYAKIVDGDKVEVSKLASTETEEGKALMRELNEMRESQAKASEEFKFEYRGEDREIEVAPGQKFKTSELVAQMSERYGIDPNLLMERAGEISSQGTEYLKDLNMTARAIQKSLISSGVPKEEWYVTQNGRRYMNPKLLRGFVGGNEEAVDRYVESSGAQYTEDEIKELKEAFPGLDGLDGADRLSDAQVRAALGSKFNIKSGAHLEGYRASATQGLLLLHEWVNSKNGGNAPKGTITDLTNTGNLGGGVRHAGGTYSHGNGYKADLRSWDEFGKALANATGLHRNGSMTITSIPGYQIKVLRHRGTGDHFDVQFKPA